MRIRTRPIHWNPAAVIVLQVLSVVAILLLAELDTTVLTGPWFAFLALFSTCVWCVCFAWQLWQLHLFSTWAVPWPCQACAIAMSLAALVINILQYSSVDVIWHNHTWRNIKSALTLVTLPLVCNALVKMSPVAYPGNSLESPSSNSLDSPSSSSPESPFSKSSRGLFDNSPEGPFGNRPEDSFGNMPEGSFGDGLGFHGIPPQHNVAAAPVRLWFHIIELGTVAFTATMAISYWSLLALLELSDVLDMSPTPANHNMSLVWCGHILRVIERCAECFAVSYIIFFVGQYYLQHAGVIGPGRAPDASWLTALLPLSLLLFGLTDMVLTPLLGSREFAALVDRLERNVNRIILLLFVRPFNTIFMYTASEEICHALGMHHKHVDLNALPDPAVIRPVADWRGVTNVVGLLGFALAAEWTEHDANSRFTIAIEFFQGLVCLVALTVCVVWFITIIPNQAVTLQQADVFFLPPLLGLVVGVIAQLHLVEDAHHTWSAYFTGYVQMCFAVLQLICLTRHGPWHTTLHAVMALLNTLLVFSAMNMEALHTIGEHHENLGSRLLGGTLWLTIEYYASCAKLHLRYFMILRRDPTADNRRELVY